MGWVIVLIIVNILVSVVTLVSVYYRRFHPNQAAQPITQIFGKRSKLKPKWHSDESAYTIEQKELKKQPVL